MTWALRQKGLSERREVGPAMGRAPASLLPACCPPGGTSGAHMLAPAQFQRLQLQTRSPLLERQQDARAGSNPSTCPAPLSVLRKKT